MTWPRRTGAERRMRDWCYWVSQLSQRREGLALGSRWHRSPARPRWVVAWEPHRSGSMHAHALLDSPTLRQVDRMHWLCQWHEYTGGMARLDTIDRADAVACYVSKYVTKDGELDFSPNVSERLPRVSAALLARGWRPSPWRALLFQRRAGATASPFVKRGQRATHEA